MGTSIVDATVESAELRRKARGISIFDTVRFKLDDGSTRTITKAVAKQAIADQLTPGSSGRFYLFNGFDLKGVHGVRKHDGTAILDFPGSNAKLFLVLGVVNLAWIVLRVTTKGDLPLLAVALIVLAAVGYILMSKTEREAKLQFESDAGHSAA